MGASTVCHSEDDAALSGDGCRTAGQRASASSGGAPARGRATVSGGFKARTSEHGSTSPAGSGGVPGESVSAGTTVFETGAGRGSSEHNVSDAAGHDVSGAGRA